MLGHQLGKLDPDVEAEIRESSHEGRRQRHQEKPSGGGEEGGNLTGGERGHVGEGGRRAIIQIT